MSRTCKTIIDRFIQRVSEKEPIAPDDWMQGAMYLNVLIGEEKSKLFSLEQAYNKVSLEHIEKGDSNAVAEKKAKGSQEWLDYKNQEAFTKQVEQFILLAKKHATINMDMGA